MSDCIDICGECESLEDVRAQIRALGFIRDRLLGEVPRSISGMMDRWHVNYLMVQDIRIRQDALCQRLGLFNPCKPRRGKRSRCAFA